MYYTYILKSNKNGRYYIGYTADINGRLSRHNSGVVAATKNFRPWVLFYNEKYDSENEAVRREKQIKSWKSRKAIEKLKF